MVLELACRQEEEGRAMVGLCAALDVGRATYYRWRKEPDTVAEAPGPKATPALVAAMRHEVRQLRHAKRRTWGTAAVYEEYRGMLPRAVIRRAIGEERTRRNRIEREAVSRYEFAAVDVAWSSDFMQVGGPGGVLRVQEERSRCTLGFEMRTAWPAVDVARFHAGAFKRYGPPLFLKHDRGTEFKAGVFQAMLRGERVIPLPSPGYYPPYNGKQERANGGVRQWLLPLRSEGPVAREVVMQEVKDSLLDANSVRERTILTGSTSERVYREGLRAQVNRAELYRRWEELRDRMMKTAHRRRGILVGEDDELTAARLAAEAVLEEWELIRYTDGTAETEEAPE